MASPERDRRGAHRTAAGDAPPADPADGVAVRFDQVSFSYDGEGDILRDATLEIRERETVCIIGPNGGGKTTLLKLLLGMLRPRTGTIEVLGTSPRHARFAIGYMPQYMTFDPRFPITVMEIVLMGRLDRRRFGFYRASDRAAARRALAEVGMEARANDAFAALSGGQRQRVLIARALACEPRILLLDEPTANVDQKVEEQLFATLDRLRASMTVIMVSHDLGVVTAMAKNVICVNREVHSHPTSSLTGRSIEEIWGMRAVAIHHRHGECHDHHLHEAPADGHQPTDNASHPPVRHRHDNE